MTTDNGNYVFGRNPVKEKLKLVRNGELILRDGINKSQVIDIIKKAKDKDIRITYLERDRFRELFGESSQGIALKISDEFIEEITESRIIEYLQPLTTSFVLILDGIKDVGNFGAILRSALLFNVDAVILPKDNSTPITDAVVKCSSGAVFQSKIVYAVNLSRIIGELKEIGYWVYAADKAGEDMTSIDFGEKTAVVMGDENKGIRELVRKNCDAAFTIPTNGKLDSLNVSVSTGIILYELNRRFSKK